MKSSLGMWSWFAVALFQLVFGLSIFAVTRYIYTTDTEVAADESSMAQRSMPEWTDRILDLDSTILSVHPPAQSLAQEPLELSNQADEFFANKQYARAAEAYERLLAFDPNNVEIHNNLGLTLYYSGNPASALKWLNEGAALDATNQRLWLTIGYVNSELGNIEQARTALTSAARMDSTTSVGKSATRMLAELP